MVASCNMITSLGCKRCILFLRGRILNFITIKEASEKWNISVRRVQVLCRQERIPGAKKFGRDWAIPEDAEKPLDGRITTGEYINWRKKGKAESDI